MRRLALLLCLLAPASTAAQDGGAQDGGARNGVERAAEAIADAAAELVGSDAGRVVLRPRVDLPEDAPHGLPAALTASARARLGDGAHVALFGGLDAEGAAAATRLGYDAMLDLDARIEGGFLRWFLTLWRGDARIGERSGRVRLDVALRRFTGFPPRLQDADVRPQTVLLPTTDVVAIAAHDLDDDGRAELVVVRADGVRVYRLEPRGRRLRARELGRAAWPAEATRAPVPRRRVIASARPDGDAVALRISELAPALRVSLVSGAVQLRVAEGPCPEGRYPMGGGCAELVHGRDFYDQLLTRGDAPTLEAQGNFFAHVYGEFADREGGRLAAEGLVTPHGRMSVRLARRGPEGDETERSVGAVGYGTALAMTDLDLDGAPELLASTASAAGEGDALVLMRALPRGALHVLWRSEPTTGPVFVAGTGDLDGDGRDELFAVEEPLERRGGARLWIVR